jgi:hypothetical protein
MNSPVMQALAQARLRELAQFMFQPPEQIAQALSYIGADPMKVAIVAKLLTAAPGAEEIPPPRSWSKDARRYWDALPHELQEYLSDRERSRDKEVRRKQDECAAAKQELTRLQALLTPEAAPA